MLKGLSPWTWKAERYVMWNKIFNYIRCDKSILKSVVLIIHLQWNKIIHGVVISVKSWSNYVYRHITNSDHITENIDLLLLLVYDDSKHFPCHYLFMLMNHKCKTLIVSSVAPFCPEVSFLFLLYYIFITLHSLIHIRFWMNLFCQTTPIETMEFSSMTSPKIMQGMSWGFIMASVFFILKWSWEI